MTKLVKYRAIMPVYYVMLSKLVMYHMNPPFLYMLDDQTKASR